MENHSPLDAENAFATPAQRARNFAKAVAGYFPNSPAAKAEASFSIPQFGSIYKGKLPNFGNGVPHYGMVKEDSALGLGKRRPSPEVPFAPISSRPVKRNELNRVLSLPAGTLPPKKFESNEYIHVVSHILLYITIPLSYRQIEEGRMRYIKTLDDSFLKQARAILAGL